MGSSKRPHNGYVEAPKPDRYGVKLPRLFLAGGITGCPDWQATVRQALESSAVVLLNPRRANFDVTDPTASEKQITWEHKYLRRATAILFWFPCETLCPIVLFELGAALERNQPLFIGCHPDYKRREDVRIQCKLRRPYVKVRETMPGNVMDVIDWLEWKTEQRQLPRR